MAETNDGMNILAKLAAIQSELKAPKSQFNKFGGYSYRNAEDILEAVKPICHKYAAVLTLTDKIVDVNGRYYVEATVTLKNVDNPSESESVTAYAREEESKKGMDGSQVTGASSSYARKYALNGLFDIDDTKDSDATNDGGKGGNTGAAGNKTASPLICSDCGKIISDSKTRNGETRSAYDIMMYSKQKFGRPLCTGCMKNANNSSAKS